MDQLLKTGLESLLKIKIDETETSNIISYKDYSSIIHGVNYNQAKNDNYNLSSKMYFQEDKTLYIRHLSGKIYEIQTNLKYLVQEIKNIFFQKCDSSIRLSEMVLLYNGKKLENNKPLSEYNIRNCSTLSLYFENSKYAIINTFDPQFDYDFTSTSDRKNIFRRGGYIYQRPCGSKRYALKVLGRFNEPNETWLGQTGAGGGNEWAVSYHNSITEENCLTTPDFNVAKKNAFTFTFNGINYYLLFQNRINPNTFIRVSINFEEYWKSPNSSPDHLRPYSICIGRI
ncbi:hypothetical protein ACTFIU_002608 [Dictyostelium citrinum]